MPAGVQKLALGSKMCMGSKFDSECPFWKLRVEGVDFGAKMTHFAVHVPMFPIRPPKGQPVMICSDRLPRSMLSEIIYLSGIFSVPMFQERSARPRLDFCET